MKAKHETCPGPKLNIRWTKVRFGLTYKYDDDPKCLTCTRFRQIPPYDLIPAMMYKECSNRISNELQTEH